jgi:catechol 2,3-dioxygenase-like lactoylglutathione lyase family enzyme
MIEGVRSVGIFVGDQDRAKSFWTEKLGFEVLQDTPFGEGDHPPRWIEVRPPDKSVILVLFTPEGEEHMVGTFSNVLFSSDDINATYQDLTAKGVEFAEPPSQQFWGWWAVFKDPDGNSYGLGQREG